MFGAKLPPRVTINEFTTIASVFTHNQFIDGTAIKGSPLALRIAAGNVPNFVDLETGGFHAHQENDGKNMRGSSKLPMNQQLRRLVDD